MTVLTVAAVVMALAGGLAAAWLLPLRRVTVWLAAGGTLGWAQWLVASLLSRTVLDTVAPAAVFVGLGMLVLAVAGIGWWRAARPRPLWMWTQEWPVIVLTLLVVAGAIPILQANDWRSDGWIMHGFYNGDTATLVALTERSLREAGLVATNPFAGNGPLEYPTLVHAGVADFVRGVAGVVPWLRALPWLVVGHIVLTIPLLFGSLDALVPRPSRPEREWLGWWRAAHIGWVEAGAVLYVLLLAWDMYVYPQSHFFITNLFVLLVLLGVSAWQRSARQSWPAVVGGALVTLVLLLANAVTGAAAVVMALMFCAGRAADRARPVWERAVFSGAGAVWLGLFVLVPPGEGALGVPSGFAYTAVPDMLRLAVVLVPLLAAVVWRGAQQPFIGAAVVALVAASLATFVFSQREIVVENASRFGYHALLVGWPWLLYPLTRVWVWLKRELWHTSRPLMSWATVWGVAVLAVSVWALPALASVASVYDNLLRRDVQMVSRDMVEALGWLDTMSEADVVVLARPVPPFAVPMLTGRALLRTDYWLSPGDELETQVVAAFAGDANAQAAVQAQADYVVLAGDERELWEVEGLIPVFENSSVTIFEL